MNDDTDEIAALKAEVERLKQSCEARRRVVAQLQKRIDELNRENKALQLKLSRTNELEDALKRIAAMGGAAFETIRKLDEK